MLQNSYDSQALFDARSKFVSKDNFRYAIAVKVPGYHIDHPFEIARDNVLFPARILIPDQIRCRGGQNDQVKFAVVIHIGGNDTGRLFELGYSMCLKLGRSGAERQGG